MALFTRPKDRMPTPAEALPGRTQKMPAAPSHFVLGAPLQPPFPSHLQTLLVGMGCFWGAERIFWQAEGVFTTAVGYSGGYTPNPTYQEVCSGLTGHNEVILVVFDPSAGGLERMLSLFWENHDPTQGMRQGNDFGTQYRSGIYTSDDAQQAAAQRTQLLYEEVLSASGYGPVTTEILPAGEFYYAEDYHQQYLAKNPAGYCGLGGTGLTLPATL